MVFQDLLESGNGSLNRLNGVLTSSTTPFFNVDLIQKSGKNNHENDEAINKE